MMRTMEDLRHCAERCITHHEACDCKQLEYREQIERLESDLSGTQLALADYSAENIQLRKDIDQLEERLFKYGRCLPDCTGKYTGGNCNCGWETVLKESEVSKTTSLLAKGRVCHFLPECKYQFTENRVVYCRHENREFPLYGKPCSKRCKDSVPYEESEGMEGVSKEMRDFKWKERQGE